MLNCADGHTTEIYVLMTDADGGLIYRGYPDADKIHDILSALDEGACPVCSGLTA